MPISFDWVVPESVRREGPDSVRRGRAVVMAGGLTAGVAVYAAWNQALQGEPAVAGVAALLAVGGMVIPTIVWATGAWRPAAVLSSVVLFAGLGGTVVATGGKLIAALYLLSLVPLLTTLTLGVRWGLAAATAGTGLLWVTRSLEAYGLVFPIQPTDGAAAHAAFRGAVIFQLLLFAIAVVLESLRAANLREATESEARYEALGAQSTDLLLELDANGRVRFANRRHCEALGWAPDALVGADVPAFVHGEDTGRFRAILAEALERGAARGMPVRLCAGDGSSRWFEPSVTGYTTPDGQRRLVVVVRDLTERVRLEEQLRQSQKMDAIGQLAGGVAHDFNNLLMVVGSYADMLVRRLPAGEDRIAAEEIARAAERGELLTRQLLAVSRPHSPRPEAILLNDVVRGLRRLLSRLISEDVVMELELDPELPPVVADPGHVEQVLVNLATNARDAMPTGGRLRIRTSRSGDRVQLAVSDTGVGMDAATRERVFEAFFTTKDRRQGTGLGLYVVYSLVAGMHGTVRVESAPGRGTVFLIDLPRAPATAAVASGDSLDRVAMAGGNETVLVVEDRPEVRGLVRTTLESVGYTVLEASEGVSGLALFDRHQQRIDLVLSDVVMPNMSGPEMAERMRAKYPDVRVLFMSGHPERARDLAKSLDDATLVMKPILPSQLCRHVRAALDRTAEAPGDARGDRASEAAPGQAHLARNRSGHHAA